MRASRAIAATVSGTLALAALALAASRGVGARGGDGRARDGGLLFGTTHCAVPARYHPAITRYSEKRDCSALTLMLFLPDLSPAADHPEAMKRHGWHDRTTPLLEHGPRMTDPDEQIAWTTTTAQGLHTSPEPAGNGCDLYRTPLMVPGDVYACPEDGSELVVACERKPERTARHWITTRSRLKRHTISGRARTTRP